MTHRKIALRGMNSLDLYLSMPTHTLLETQSLFIPQGEIRASDMWHLLC